MEQALRCGMDLVEGVCRPIPNHEAKAIDYQPNPHDDGLHEDDKEFIAFLRRTLEKSESGQLGDPHSLMRLAKELEDHAAKLRSEARCQIISGMTEASA
ncbi:MAG TPA: hypothetical protein V6D17_09415 [Candidatus Obscuribacterales bacterium]